MKYHVRAGTRVSPSQLITAPLAKRHVPPHRWGSPAQGQQQLSLFTVVGGFFFLERLQILLRHVDASLHLKVK